MRSVRVVTVPKRRLVLPVALRIPTCAAIPLIAPITLFTVPTITITVILRVVIPPMRIRIAILSRIIFLLLLRRIAVRIESPIVRFWLGSDPRAISTRAISAVVGVTIWRRHARSSDQAVRFGAQEICE